MTIKSTLFLLPFMLLIARMGSAIEEAEIQALQHRQHHAEAPVLAPAEAPVHAPKGTSVHAMADSPVRSPPKPPVYPLTHGCGAMCAFNCKTIFPRRPCMRTCTACCAKCKCVPGFMQCSNWDNVVIHGYMIKCP